MIKRTNERNFSDNSDIGIVESFTAGPFGGFLYFVFISSFFCLSSFLFFFSFSFFLFGIANQLIGITTSNANIDIYLSESDRAVGIRV